MIKIYSFYPKSICTLYPLIVIINGQIIFCLNLLLKAVLGCIEIESAVFQRFYKLQPVRKEIIKITIYSIKASHASLKQANSKTTIQLTFGKNQINRRLHYRRLLLSQFPQINDHFRLKTVQKNQVVNKNPNMLLSIKLFPYKNDSCFQYCLNLTTFNISSIYFSVYLSAWKALSHIQLFVVLNQQILRQFRMKIIFLLEILVRSDISKYNSTHNSKMSNHKHSKNNYKSTKTIKKDCFDQEEQNFDALQMREHHDAEYDALLKSSTSKGNLKKNAYFFNDNKYSGTKALQQDNQDEELPEDDSGEQQNQIASAIKTFQQQKKKQSKLLTQDVRKIDEEDEEYQVMRKKQKTSDQALDEAIGLKDQLNCQKMLIEYRYSEQNLLESLKRFPKSNFPKNQNLHQLHKELELNIVKNLSLLTKAYSSYSHGIFNTSQLSSYVEQYQQNYDDKSDEKLNVSYLHQTFTNESQQITKNAQKQLVKWSQKTNLINISSSHYTSLLMQTPVGQAKKILSNWDRVKNKCQQKRGIFKILFQDQENVRESTDPQIFDDFELFTELQKNFISSIEDQKDFRVSDTLRYLKNRENREEKTKEVDRKASKNRKLRFNVHPKLLNFLPSYPENTIQVRDEIVQNFFNCKAREIVPQKNREDGQTYYIDM